MKLPIKKNIFIAGEDLSVKGGITSVLGAYLNSSLKEEFHLYHLRTLVEGSKFAKTRIFFQAFFLLICRAICGKIDLIHIHSSSYASFYRKSMLVQVSKLFRIPVIFHIHGSRFHHFYNDASPLSQRWISRTLNQVEQIIVLSRSWQKRVSAMTQNSKIEILNNPVNLKELQPANRAGTKTDFTVLFLGELTRRKGIFDLLPVAEALCTEFSQLRFVLAGNGDLEKVRQIVAPGKFAPRILIPGWVNPAQRKILLQQADLFILPSYEEGLPVALLEAMASGLPVVSTFAGGIAELVTSGKNGLLVQPGNQQELKCAIQKMIEDETLRKKFAAVNRQKMVEGYDIQIIAKKVRELYLRLARKR